MKKFLSLAIGVPICAVALAGATKAVSSVIVSEPQAPTLFALVTDCQDWALTEPHRGVYSISDNLQLSQIAENNSMTGDVAFYADGKYYISKASMVGTFMVTGNMVSVFDAETGNQIETRQMPANFNNVALAYAFDSANDEAYAITYGGNTGVYVLNGFDRTNFAYTPLVQLKSGYSAIATDPEGKLYGIKNSTLYRISISDGTEERLLAWDETPASNTPQAMVYSGDYKSMLWSFTNSDMQTSIISFSLEEDNLRTKKIGELGKYAIKALHSTASLLSESAPEAPKSVTFTFAEPGALNGKLNFIAPEYSIGGEKLQSDLSVNLYVDGQDVERESISAGAAGFFDVTFSEGGNHKLSLEFVAGGQKGERSTINVYAGFDTPAAVTGLTYTLEGNDIILRWDEAQSLNGGTLQPLKYEIAHNGEKVGTVTETSFSMSINTPQSLHSFTVTAIAGDNRSESTTLSDIVAGTAFNVPYKCTFATQDEFALYTVINANEDRSTWKYMDYYKSAQYNKTYGDGDGNDYLISPRISFEKDKVYALRFTTQDNGPKPESLRVLLTEGANLKDMEEAMSLYSNNNLTNRDKVTFETFFTAPKDGDFNLAFHYNTAASNSQNINLFAVELECLGKSSSPKAVENLSIVPGENASLVAQISFIAPVEAFDGSRLEAIDKIELSRDSEIIYTFQHPRPGSIVEYTDTDIANAGTHLYSVCAYNESGNGQTVSSDVYIGALTLPLQYTSFADADFIIENQAETDGWSINPENGNLTYSGNTEGHHYDKVCTPAFYLNKGKIVNATFNYEALNHNTEASSQIFFVGLARIDLPNPQIIYPAFVVRPEENVITESRRISIQEDGIYQYCFIFDGYINATQNTGVSIASLEINTDLVPGAPSAVTNYEIAAAEGGLLEGVFKFDLPEINLGNEPLDGTVGVRIYNPRHELIGEITECTPGDHKELQLPLIQGLQSYTITTYNNNGIGASASRAAFAGIDIPMRITGLISNPSADNMSTDLSWDLPDVGVHQGWFDVSLLRYKVFVDDKYVATTDRREYYFTTDETLQREYKFSVIPVTEAGEGTQPVSAVNFLGKPLQLPFREDFNGGEFGSTPWRTEGYPMAECHWRPMNDFKGESALVLEAHLLTESDVWLPKLSFAEHRDVQLTFDMFKYHKWPEAGSYIEVLISDDEVNYSSKGRFYAEQDGEGWQNISIDLSDYTNSPWVSICIRGSVHESVDVAAIKNIRVGGESAGSIKTTESSSPIITGGKGCIHIQGSEGPVQIYDLNGIAIARATDGILYIPSGIYIVTLSSGKSEKVCVY